MGDTEVGATLKAISSFVVFQLIIEYWILIKKLLNFFFFNPRGINNFFFKNTKYF